jgi:hypothetical protein
MNNQPAELQREISRRDLLKALGIGTISLTLTSTGCVVLEPVIVEVAPVLGDVLWGAVEVAPKVMKVVEFVLTVKAVVNAAEQFLSPDVSAKDIAMLQRNAPLIIQDGSGRQFNTPYFVCEYAGIVQSCYHDAPDALYTNPSANSRATRQLIIGESLGVIDLAHVNGWYHVQTLRGEKGWVHGNCLQRLPRKY